MAADTLFWFRFWLFWHIAGVLGFLAAHGATAAVAFRLRSERDRGRIRALLELSRSTRSWMYVSLIVLIGAGVANGFVLHVWGQGWIWAAIGLLAVLLLAAFPMAVPYYIRVRRAVTGEPAPSPDELEVLLRAPRPIVIAVVETAGILVILWLMVFRPF
ncbi:MAG TPA: hypothetical protein VE646_08390 [Actinomycetota bacterium]|nr:hypothetical protein [Actinomycetota bacterium]